MCTPENGPQIRWLRSTNPSTPRPPIPLLYCLIRSLHCNIFSLDAPSFLHSTAKFLQSTAKFLYSTPPDSFTPQQNFFTPRFRVSLSSVCPASAGSRNCHLTVTRVTHYAHWRVRCSGVPRGGGGRGGAWPPDASLGGGGRPPSL